MIRHNAGLIFLLAGMALVAPVSFGASLEIAVRHTFGAEPLRLDSLRYQNAASETLSVTRLSYLLGGFALERADGTWMELTNQTAWLDAAQRRTVLQLGNIPAGAYRSIRWHVGIETNANHADPAPYPADHPLNPNLNGLYWSWQGGYIFLALEGIWRTDVAASRQSAASSKIGRAHV